MAGNLIPPKPDHYHDTDIQAMNYAKFLIPLIGFLGSVSVVLAFFHIPISHDMEGIILIVGIILGFSCILYWIHRTGQKYHWDRSKWD